MEKNEHIFITHFNLVKILGKIQVHMLQLYEVEVKRKKLYLWNSN